MSISLDLMLLPNMTGSRVNLPFGNHLGGRKSYVEFKHTFPAQLSSAIKLCPLVLCFDPRIASLLTPNLVTILVCYPSFAQCLFLQSNWCHWKFHFGCQFSNGVMINILWCRDKTESLLWARTQGCATRHVLVSRFLVTIHCRTTPMCYFHVSSSLIISPYHVKRSICRTRCNRTPL